MILFLDHALVPPTPTHKLKCFTKDKPVKGYLGLMNVPLFLGEDATIILCIFVDICTKS